MDKKYFTQRLASLETSYNDFMVELAPTVFNFIVERRDEKDIWVPVIEGKRFFLKPVKYMHIDEVKITGIADKKVREEMLQEAQVFS